MSVDKAVSPQKNIMASNKEDMEAKTKNRSEVVEAQIKELSTKYKEVRAKAVTAARPARESGSALPQRREHPRYAQQQVGLC